MNNTFYITSLPERREAVNAINHFDRENGIKSSQRAKHEKTVWEYICCVLPAGDRRGITFDQIIKRLKKHNIDLSYDAVYRAISIMWDTESAIKPHRRSCGVSCHEVVTRLGLIRQKKYSNIPCRRASYTFTFAVKQKELNYWKRAFNLNLNPK